MLSELKIAVLIDGENISAKYADVIFKKVAVYGDALVKKVYVSPNFNGWKPKLFKHAIEMEVRPAYVSGKNVLDIALVLDAMDLMHIKQGIINCFCIVSNDSDFALLAMRLRADGLNVIGFGENKAVDSFVNACDDFVYLDKVVGVKKAVQPDDNQKTAVKTQPQLESVKNDSIKAAQKILLEAVNALAGQTNDSGWLNLSRVMSYLKRINPDFSVNAYGCKQLKELVEKTKCFDIKTGENGVAHIQVKNKKPVKKKKT